MPAPFKWPFCISLAVIVAARLGSWPLDFPIARMVDELAVPVVRSQPGDTQQTFPEQMLAEFENHQAVKNLNASQWHRFVGGLGPHRRDYVLPKNLTG